MNRYTNALRIAPERPSLELMAEQFLHAVQECRLEGKDPILCPAVMLMGGYIAFATHADISTPLMYDRLHQMCAAQSSADFIIRFDKVN